ncbi:MAG: hypothetical protein V4623_02280 [Pseudomonadota bacterium]
MPYQPAIRDINIKITPGIVAGGDLLKTVRIGPKERRVQKAAVKVLGTMTKIAIRRGKFCSLGFKKHRYFSHDLQVAVSLAHDWQFFRR